MRLRLLSALFDHLSHDSNNYYYAIHPRCFIPTSPQFTSPTRLGYTHILLTLHNILMQSAENGARLVDPLPTFQCTLVHASFTEVVSTSSTCLACRSSCFLQLFLSCSPSLHSACHLKVTRRSIVLAMLETIPGAQSISHPTSRLDKQIKVLSAL